MSAVDYAYAFFILGFLVAGMLIISFVLKKYQRRWQSQGDVKLESGMFVDTKRRVMILTAFDKKYLYVIGPHNDYLVSMESGDLWGAKNDQSKE